MLLGPALDELALALGAPALERRHRGLQELARLRVGLGVDGARDVGPRVVGDEVEELRARLLGGDDDHARAAQAANELVEHLGDAAEVVLGELVGVALEARLRPAALVVAPGLLLRVVGEILELPRAQPVETPLLAAHDEDERPLPAPDEWDERREVEAVADPDLVRHDLGERKRPPDVVEPGAEDGETVRALALELGVEEPANAVEVLAQREALLVRELALPGAVALRRLVEERIQTCLRVAGGVKEAGIEVEVDADRNALLGLETGEIAELVPGDGSCHLSALVGFP